MCISLLPASQLPTLSLLLSCSLQPSTPTLDLCTANQCSRMSSHVMLTPLLLVFSSTTPLLHQDAAGN